MNPPISADLSGNEIEGGAEMKPDDRDVDLRRKSFRGQRLESADFDGTDLRGADFSAAHLAGASFRNARLGVPLSTGVSLFVAALVCSVAAGLVTGLSLNAVRDRLYGSGWEEQSGAAGIIFVLLLFVVVMFWKGLDTAIKAFAVSFVVILVLSLTVRFIWGDIDLALTARGIGLALVLALAVLAGILGRVVGGAFGAWAIGVVAVLGGLAAGRAEGGLAALVVTFSLVLISKRALRGDRRDRSIRRVAHRIISRWGTRFANADMAGADFSGTDATNCDITGAVTDGVTWEAGHAPLASPDRDRG